MTHALELNVASASPQAFPRMPNLGILLLALDGAVHGMPSAYEIVAKHLRWSQKPMIEQTEAGTMLNFWAQGHKCGATFSIPHAPHRWRTFREGAHLELTFEETRKVSTRFRFCAGTKAAQWGLVLARAYSHLDELTYPILGYPAPCEVTEMRSIIRNFLKSKGVADHFLFQGTAGGILAAIAGLEIAIDWRTGMLGNIESLEEIGRRVMADLRGHP